MEDTYFMLSCKMGIYFIIGALSNCSIAACMFTFYSKGVSSSPDLLSLFDSFALISKLFVNLPC